MLRGGARPSAAAQPARRRHAELRRSDEPEQFGHVERRKSGNVQTPCDGPRMTHDRDQ
jgi:hypothetical protein